MDQWTDLWAWLCSPYMSCPTGLRLREARRGAVWRALWAWSRSNRRSRPSPSTVGPLRQLRQLRQQVNEKREDEKTRSGCWLHSFPPADSIRVPRGPNEGWLTTRPKAVGERARAAGAACAAGEDRECDAPTTGGTIPALACTATCARASARGARRARTRERRHPQRQGRERERRHHTC